MAILIDPPRWPAHGTEFSHAVSDCSLNELHAFAERIGLSRRAFDEDHYDVPSELYGTALEQGAQPVSGSELIRRLRSSGLRVPAKERIGATIRPLRHRWSELGIGREELGEALLQRWSEPHRHYHTPAHLLHCLESIDELAAQSGLRPPSLEVRLAAWFHDAVYNGVQGEDEEASATLALEKLGCAVGAEVARLVLLTISHEVDEDDRDGQLLVDADLAILGAPPARYRRYMRRVRAEYAHHPDEEWQIGRRRVIGSLLDRSHIFMTRMGRALWEDSARRNLLDELPSVSRLRLR